jgi:hypothetical protein
MKVEVQGILNKRRQLIAPININMLQLASLHFDNSLP